MQYALITLAGLALLAIAGWAGYGIWYGLRQARRR